MMNLIKYLTLIFILTSCSFKSLFISNLDWIIVQKIDKQLHLYNDQEKQFKKELNLFLSDEAKRLEEISLHIKNMNLSKIDVQKENQYIQNLYQGLENRFLPLLINCFSSLDKEQKAKFLKSFNVKTAEFKEDLDKKDEEEYFERFEVFIGELTDKQKEVIKQAIPEMKAHSLKWVKRRQQTEEKFSALFQQSLSTEGFARKMQDMFEFNSKQRSSASENSINLKVIKEVLKLLTAKQKASFEEFKGEALEWIEIYIEEYKK